MIFLVLEDFVAGSVSASAGSLLDSTSINIAQLQSAGLAVVVYNPATMEASRLAFLAARGSRPAVPDNSGDLTALLLAAGALGGGGGVASVSGAAPITSTGGATPIIGIGAATPLLSGSMSAADKTKLDALPASPVTSVTASAPLASSGGATPDISLTAGAGAGDVLTWNGASWAGAAPVDTGITELTGDVSAGPGSGSQAATVAGLQGNPVSAAAPGGAGDVLAWDGAQWAPAAPPGGGPSLALAAVRVATAAPLPANSYAAGVLTASAGGSINAVGIDGVTTLALADRVLVKDETAALENQVYTITDLGSPASGPATPAVPAPPSFSGALLTCGSGGTYATLTAAVAAAAPGDRIQILPGTIVEAAAVAVNKSLEIFGTGATCIVQRNATTAVLAVTASNVYLHDFKIINNQLASADPGGQSACVGADTMNRTSLGGATGLYFANLTCEMPKVGIFVSGTSWVVRDCAFSPSAANTTAGTTLRAVFAYGSEGTSFINDNTFLTTLDNSRLTAIYLNTRNDGIAPNWEGGYKGSLIIDGNVINDAGGAPRSYIDATSIYHQSGTATTAPPTGEFSLYVVNNDFSLDHQSSPCVFFGRAYGATPVAPLSFFLDLVVSDNLFGAREASASQKGALFWTNSSGGAVAMGAIVGGFYGANNTIAPMVLPGTNTSIMADSSLLMVRENAYYNAPSPLLTLVPLNPGSPWELTVAADFVAAAARGAFASVNAGTANAATTWIVVTPDPITLGTTALTWDLFGAVSVAGGDLSGTFPNPTVAKIQGNAVSATAPADGEVLTWDNAASEWVPAAPTGGGAVYAGALTVYVDPVNGTDAPGGGTLGAPYASINYAYSQVPSLGDPLNVTYNAQVGQFVTEKLVFQLAPGRYSENVVLGFRRGRVQLVGNGVQILGSVTMRALRADFPAANMESIKASFPAPYTGAGTLATFEITGSSGGGVEADATADPFVVTGLSMLLFDEPTVPGTISSGTAWENNYGQFNFYANKAYLVGGMVYSTSYVSTPTRGLCTSVLEVDGSTIGESAIPYRSYLGAVPYAYAADPTLWNKGTGVATGAQSSTTLQDTTKAWTVNEYAGATVVITAGTGAGQSRTVLSNTATALTVSAAWGTTPVAASSVYSLVGVANKVAEGTLTAKVHNTTLGASVGPRVTLGELDGCRVYDMDQTMLGTVDNGGVTGSISSSYLGSVINQFRQYSGTGIPASQYRLGSNLSGTRYKIDSTSYTTLAFNRSSTTGALTARTLNVPTASGTATAGAATTLTDSAAAWTTNRWAGGTLTLTGGTGSGQSRTISSNTATAITVSPAWATNPAAGTTYTVTALVAFDFQDDARSLAYTPTTGAQWLDPDPTTVGSALDKVGGLGLLAAAPSNGQIPIGNGASFTPATLTAGANIAIANGAGSVSVAVSASPNGTFYVAQGGSDVTGTGSILAPFASISAALAVAGAGTVVSVGPGTFTEAAPLAIPLDRSVVGSPETTIVAPAGVTMSEGTALENVSLTTPTIATTGTRPAGPGATVNLTRVFVTSATTVNNNGTNTAFNTTNTTFGGATTINGGPTNSVVYDYSRASSSTTINNTTSFSATASSFLSISSTNSTTALSNTSVTGNVAVSGGSLSATSSTIGGSLNASAAAAVNLSLDSQPQGGSTLAGGATLGSLTIVPQNVALDGTATLSTPATIGSVYVPQARTLTAGSLGFFGGSLITDTSSLTLVPSGGGPAAATWTRTGLLGSQALTSGGAVIAGWYDIVLTPGASGTAFARGLYLV